MAATTGRLQWDKTGERLYETGDRNVALYPYAASATTPTGAVAPTHYPEGVAWNGITAMTETPSGAEATDLWADDTKYATMRSAEQFGGTIEAYTYPEEWGECDGSKIVNRVILGQQSRKAFGLAYITTIGNDTELNDHGEKLHLIYNATASPSERSYATINDSPEAITFSWEYQTTPVEVTYNGTEYKKVSCLTIDSTKVAPATYAAFKTLVFGGPSTVPHLPEPNDVLAYFGTAVTFEYTAVTASTIDDWDYTYYQYFTKDSDDNYNQIGVLDKPPMTTNTTPTTGYGPYIGPYYKQSIDDGQG